MFCQEEGLNLNVRASMGVATYPHDAKTPREIIRQADEMMYLVKNTSRDNIWDCLAWGDEVAVSSFRFLVGAKIRVGTAALGCPARATFG